jgi:hypothetical protein
MNDILEKLKANWMLIAGVIVAYMFLGKKSTTRRRMRRRGRMSARRSYGRMRRMRRR